MPYLSQGKFTIRNLNILDLIQVADLHCKAFEDSALTKLGKEPVRRYYEWQITGPHESYFVGVFDRERLVGFCVGGVFRGALRGFLNKNKNFLLGWVLKRPWLLTNSLIQERIKLSFHVLRIKRSVNPSKINISGSSFGILSIAVDPEIQGFGVGKIILDDIENTAKTAGYNKMHLSVHPSNLVAVSFYEKNGWIKRNDTAGIWTGDMEKDIS